MVHEDEVPRSLSKEDRLARVKAQEQGEADAYLIAKEIEDMFKDIVVGDTSHERSKKVSHSRPKRLKRIRRPEAKAQPSKPAKKLARALKEREILVSIDTVRSKQTKWLWEGMIPLGAVTYLAGPRGTGKSQYLTHIAAKLSLGELEGEFKGSPMATWGVFAEDDISRTVKPRFQATEAENELILIAGEDEFENGFTLSSCMEKIREVLEKNPDVKLILLDPITAMMTSKQRDYSGVEVRKLLQDMGRMAAEYEVSFLCSAHFAKTANSDPLNRILGSSEQVNVVRCVLATENYDQDEFGPQKFILSQIKNNLGPISQTSIVYGIVTALDVDRDENGASIESSRIEVCGEVSRTVEDISRDKAAGKTREPNKATKWLRDLLQSSGPLGRPEIVAKAAEEGIPPRSIDRAKADLNVVTSRSKENHRVTLWFLPE